jgi:hypothetical protein
MHFKDRRIHSLSTPEQMRAILRDGNPLSAYKKGTLITVDNKMETGYQYRLSEDPGKNLGFDLQVTPPEMLRRGVFSGKYANDMILEFPKEWFEEALEAGKLCPGAADPAVNEFGVASRLTIGEWKDYGWLPGGKAGAADAKATARNAVLSDPKKNHDPRGFFEWLMRYYLGRREPEIDAIQIKRYQAIVRHAGQVKKLGGGDLTKRRKQRQTLLNWGWDPIPDRRRRQTRRARTPMTL